MRAEAERDTLEESFVGRLSLLQAEKLQLQDDLEQTVPVVASECGGGGGCPRSVKLERRATKKKKAKENEDTKHPQQLLFTRDGGGGDTPFAHRVLFLRTSLFPTTDKGAATCSSPRPTLRGRSAFEFHDLCG